MKFGTVVYKNKIYNLDYMKIDELKKLLEEIENENKNNFDNAKKLVKNQ